MLLRLEEADEPDDAGMIYASHDLDLFEDVGALSASVSIDAWPWRRV